MKKEKSTIVKENVIKTYSNQLKHYSKIRLWKSEKNLIKKYFSNKKVKILDIGCGAGRTTIPLAKLGYNVTAIDITPAMIKLAKQNTKNKKVNARIELGDATKLKYSSDFFDYALFSFNGIEAIPGKENRFKALEEIYRVLKPNGIFIFTTNTTNYYKHYDKFFFQKAMLKSFLSKLFYLKNNYSKLKDFEFGDCFLKFNPPMFMHFSTIKNVKKNLRKIGFQIVYSEFRDIIEKKNNPNLTKDYFYVCKKEGANLQKIRKFFKSK